MIDSRPAGSDTRPRRLSPAAGLERLRDPDLPRLGALAQEARFRLHPAPRVTFVVDTNPNYTNVCDTSCLFCAFHRPPGHPEAFTLTVEEVVEKARRAAAAGATTMLLQGGINPDLPLDYFVSLVRGVRQAVPGMIPHFFSPPEIAALAERSGLTTRAVLERLREAGQETLPGGGAEILVRRVRERLSPAKGPPERWLEVMREAHRLGMRSTATMMYGHLEEEEEVIEHLERLRALQDETGGFTAFIPWSFKGGNSPFGRARSGRAGPLRYLRILAVARLYLDNFPHIQASWFSEGREAGQLALHFGADDFGGTLLEEHVHRAADFLATASVEEVRSLIRAAGFEPAQRDTLYNPIG